MTLLKRLGLDIILALGVLAFLAVIVAYAQPLQPNAAQTTSKPCAPDTILIETAKRQLTHCRPDGEVWYYRISVGRPGFVWTGEVTVGRMAEWPTWVPPKEMLERQPHLPRVMKGGIDNPLGARALYLHKGGKDTLYRIHGSDNEGRWSIGQNVSSGCFRMTNADVIQMYKHVKVGTKVIVRR